MSEWPQNLMNFCTNLTYSQDQKSSTIVAAKVSHTDILMLVTITF